MQAREEAEALYQALVEGALDAMLVVDRQTRRFVLANVAAERLLGYSRAELRSLGPRDLTPPEDLEAFDLAVAQLQAAGYWRGECRVRRKDGETLAVEVAASAVRIGQRLSYQGLLRDLSERKRLEAEQEGCSRGGRPSSASPAGWWLSRTPTVSCPRCSRRRWCWLAPTRAPSTASRRRNAGWCWCSVPWCPRGWPRRWRRSTWTTR